MRSRRGAAFAGIVAATTAVPIPLDGRTAAHAYDGIGALSAGASSRLLRDYAEPARSDILDLLFKPQWGAGLHILKVEIGGDAQSTDGSEPSHMHTRDDLSCGRGYESWLLTEARARNPAIKTYGLSWAAPRWVGDGNGDGKGYYSGDNLQYQVTWLECIRNTTGITIDHVGTWNEKYYGGSGYTVALRAALDAGGFGATRIVIPDNGWGIQQKIVEEAASNATFAAAFDAMGLHYPCDAPDPNVTSVINKAYWASEDWSTAGNWSGAGCWGRLLNQNYVRMNMTATIAWSLIWAASGVLPFFGAGLMLANEPWSGHYDGGGPVDTLDGPIWVTAHTTQFVQVGWRYLHVPGGGSGYLPASAGNGSYVTLVPPNRLLPDFTLVIEKLAGLCLHCDAPGVADGTATFATAGGLAGPGARLQVWRSNESTQFWRDADAVVAADATFSVRVPADSIVTVSTIAGARRGAPSAPVPPPGAFPLPFSDDFSGYAYDATPRFFSDQTGTFAARNGSLVQVVPVDPGPNRWAAEDVDPLTLVGDARMAADVTAGATAAFPPPPANASANATTYVQLCGRVAKYTGFHNGPPPGCCLLLNATGGWVARTGAAVVASGHVAGAGAVTFDPTVPRRLSLAFAGAAFSGWLDGAPLFAGAATAPYNESGAVALGCGYHLATFGNVTITAPA